MYLFKKFNALDPKAKAYHLAMGQAFPRLSYTPDERDIHLALFFNQSLLGGVTLENVNELDQDDALKSYWQVSNLKNVIKLKRLWVKPNLQQNFVSLIISQAFLDVDPDKVIYGVLSFPYKFAKEHEDFFLRGEKILTAKFPMQEKENGEVSSEGEKLLNLYQSLGAKPLSELSGCAEDGSIRGVVGIKVRDFILRNGVRSYV